MMTDISLMDVFLNERLFPFPSSAAPAAPAAQSFEDEQRIYIIMELCTGGDLFDRLEDHTQLTERDAAAVIAKIVKAVGYCHARGLAHRDLKLENIMLESTAAHAEIKLIDFGLSRHMSGRVTRMKTVVGTLGRSEERV